MAVACCAVQVERMTAHDPVEKEMATQKKEERKAEAELNKQEVREHNAAARQAGANKGYTTGSTGTTTYSTTGTHGQPTGPHQMSAVPGHGSGQPTAEVVEGTVGSHPIGTNTGTGGTTAHNARVGGGAAGYGTGGTYS